MKTCEYIPPFDNTRWAIKGRETCAALTEDGKRFCPAHRGGVERAGQPQPKVKRDLELDVLPWSEQDAQALNVKERQKAVKRER